MSDLLRILVAPLAWLAMFSAVYGLHGILCANGIEATANGGVSTGRLVFLAAYLLAIAIQGTLLYALYSSKFGSASHFVRFTSRTTGWVGLAATVWTLMPAATTTFCV